MSAEQDSSTRTIAGVAAVIALLALLLGIVQSARTGLIAQYAGTANMVAQENDGALQDQITQLNVRLDALEKGAAEMKAESKKAKKAGKADKAPE